MNYNDYQPMFEKIGRNEPRAVRLGTYPLRRDTVTIERGQNLKLGAVLGRKSNGKFALCSKFAADGTTQINDGSQRPVCVLQIDVDSTDADVVAPVYRTGSMLILDLNVGKGYTLDDLREDLAARCIFLDKGED